MPEREPDPIERMALAHRSAPEGTSSPIERMLAAVKELRAIAQGNRSESSSRVIDWLDWIISYHDRNQGERSDLEHADATRAQADVAAFKAVLDQSSEVAEQSESGKKIPEIEPGTKWLDTSVDPHVVRIRNDKGEWVLGEVIGDGHAEEAKRRAGNEK